MSGWPGIRTGESPKASSSRLISQGLESIRKKDKKWEYGYNKDYDFIVISKNGTIGEIYEIQNLRIALPAESKSFKRSEKKKEQYGDDMALSLSPEFQNTERLEEVARELGIFRRRPDRSLDAPLRNNQSGESMSVHL